jgi:uncharacterized protein (TIGR00369 family)
MTQRSRLVEWEDPLIGAQAALSLSGLEYLQKVASGELPGPPIARLMNFTGFDVESGRAVFRALPDESVYNPIGLVHGGFTSTLLDSAMGCAVHSTLPVGSGYTTLELKVHMVRPITVDTGEVTCTGTVIHAGRRVATAEGRLTDASGKLYAHGTTTCMILSQERE